MTTTSTEPEVYITCENYCGLKITATGDEGVGQHAADCGAPEAERARLDGELKVKKIRAAATAGDEGADEELDAALPPDAAPPATFRCSCGDVFPDWVPLGDHQTATGHVGMWTEPNDALDDDALRERESSTTVNGEPARIVHNSQPPLIEAAATDDSVLGNLARAMEIEAKLRTEANKAKNALAHAVKQTKAAAEYAAQHWANSRQMAMNLTSGGTEPDDDDGDDA